MEKMTSNSQAPGAELRERLVERVEGRDADADALLLAERLEDRRVEVVGVVVDLQLAAALGLGRARDRVAEPGSDDRVVAARRAGCRRCRPDRPRWGRRGCPCRRRAGAVGGDRRGGVLAAGQRRADAGGERPVPHHGAAATVATALALRPALKARSKHADDYPTRQAVVKVVHASLDLRADRCGLNVHSTSHGRDGMAQARAGRAPRAGRAGRGAPRCGPRRR